MKHVWISSLFVLACGSDTRTGEGGDGSTTDIPSVAEIDGDPYCHIDCLDGASCIDGVVKVPHMIAVPCAYWDGSCPLAAEVTCVRGCWQGNQFNVRDPSLRDEPEKLCTEYHAKYAGDLCTTDAECEPQVATRTEAGLVSTVHLRCDIALGQCVEYEPSPTADWMSPCGLIGAVGGAQRESGYVRTDACEGGRCLVVETEACLRQGCTMTCDHDGDCPQGATCVTNVADLSPGAVPDGGPRWGSVCQPGWPGAVGEELVCRDP